MSGEPTADELEALEQELRRDPEIQAELERYRPLVRKLSNKGLVALRLVTHDEIGKRARELAPPTRIGQHP